MTAMVVAKVLRAALLVLALNGCVMPGCGLDDAPCSSLGDESFEMVVEVDVPAGAPLSRSSFSDADLQRITDLNVFVYSDGRLMRRYSKYFADTSSLMLILPADMDKFNIYIVGNVGPLTAPEKESEIGSLKYVTESYADFRERGFPVAEAFIGYARGDLAHFRLKRLVGQYNVRMRTSADDAKYLVTDIRLHNCAKDVYPFGYGTGASSFLDDGDLSGDALTEEDLKALNAGETVSLYFVENVQGVLLPGNTDRKKKIPNSLELVSQGLADACTYMEITADITTLSARYTDGKYRFYLGQDELTDFSIRRSTLYSVTLDFTQNMVNEEEWRIEVGEPEVVGVRIDKTEAMVVKGVEDMVYVQAFDNYGRLMDFDVEVLSGGKNVNVEKVVTDYLSDPRQGTSLGLRLTSGKELCGLYSFGSEPEYVTEIVRLVSRETYNGNPLYVKDIKVRVYDRLFPLLINLEKRSGDVYSIVLKGHNPMGLTFSVSASYACGDQVSSTSAVTQGGDFGCGEEFGILNEGATEQNISRIDFRVKAISAEGDRSRYPRFISSADVYTGPDSEAFFGPGKEQYPALFPDMPANAQYYMKMEHQAGSFWSADHNTDDSDMTFSYVSDGFRQSFVVPWELLSDTYRQNWTQYHFYAPLRGVHGREYNPKSPYYDDYSQYADTPFYFVNGGLVAESSQVNIDGKVVRYPNESVRGFTYRFYGPGRDLFPENRLGKIVGRIHEMAYSIAVWKPMIGSRISSRQRSKYYESQLYMTINGASSWCGNDVSEAGFFAD